VIRGIADRLAARFLGAEQIVSYADVAAEPCTRAFNRSGDEVSGPIIPEIVRLVHREFEAISEPLLEPS
jgi:hypothetical protein